MINLDIKSVAELSSPKEKFLVLGNAKSDKCFFIAIDEIVFNLISEILRNTDPLNMVQYTDESKCFLKTILNFCYFLYQNNTQLVSIEITTHETQNGEMVFGAKAITNQSTNNVFDIELFVSFVLSVIYKKPIHMNQLLFHQEAIVDYSFVLSFCRGIDEKGIILMEGEQDSDS